MRTPVVRARPRARSIVLCMARLALLAPLLSVPLLMSGEKIASAEVARAPKIRVKLAYVDVERCLGESEDGLRAKAMLRKISDRRQVEVSQVEEQLKKEQEEIQRIAQEKGPAAGSAPALEYQKHFQSYNELLKRVNADISAREEEIFAPIDRKLRQILVRIAEAEGYDVILDRKTVPAGRIDFDLTERVLREYNWGTTPAAGVARPPAR